MNERMLEIKAAMVAYCGAWVRKAQSTVPSFIWYGTPLSQRSTV